MNIKWVVLQALWSAQLSSAQLSSAQLSSAQLSSAQVTQPLTLFIVLILKKLGTDHWHKSFAQIKGDPIFVSLRMRPQGYKEGITFDLSHVFSKSD